MKGLRFLVGLAGPRAPLVVLGGVALNGLIAVTTPLFLKALFDRGVAAKDLRQFAALAAAFALTATAWRLLGLLQNLLVHRLKHDLLRRLTRDLLAKRFRLASYEGEAGRAASLVLDEPLAAAQTAMDLSLSVASAGAGLAAALLLLAGLSVPVTAVLVVCMPLLDRLAASYGAAVKEHTHGEKEEEALLRGFVTRAVQAARTVRLFGLEEAAQDGLSGRLSRYEARSGARNRAAALHNALSGILLSNAELLVVVLCGWSMMDGAMTFGGFMAYMSGFWGAAGSLRALTQRMPELAKADALVERLELALAAPEEPVGTEGTLGAALDGVEVRRGGRAILSGLTLRVGPGERILLLGPNGAGKSTAADVMTGFARPDAGRRDIPPLSRVSAATTPQHFLPGTVRGHFRWERLAPGARRSLEGMLTELGLAACLDRDPETLSAGEKKKLAVALALAKDADLYVFDEPLANVDEASKPAVMRRIFERTQGRALVMSLHGDQEHAVRFDRLVRLAPPLRHSAP